MANPPPDRLTVTSANARPRCGACGSDQTVIGKLHGDVAFKPPSIRKFFHLTGVIRMDAFACATCGYVSLYLDPARLIDLAGDPQDES